MSLLYAFTYQRVRQMEQDANELRRERDALREQAHSANQEAYEAREQAFLAALRGGGDTAGGGEQGSGLWFGDEQYQPPIRVASYTMRVNGRTVEVGFRLVNQGASDNNRGGFLFAIFENSEATPIAYRATPRVNTNEDGFPQTYKSGIRFTRIRNAVTFRRKVRRTSTEEFFTHVTLFLFSVRGGLLLKERYELERDLFYKDQPVVRTHRISNI